jgi:hypothetical protein
MKIQREWEVEAGVGIVRRGTREMVRKSLCEIARIWVGTTKMKGGGEITNFCWLEREGVQVIGANFETVLSGRT